MSFTDFLDSLLSDNAYRDFVTALRQAPNDNFYKGSPWHSVSFLLQPYPEAIDALKKYAYHRKDINISFSEGNLKACYIIDEDFINNGRAFILFNFVATTWFHMGQVGEQNSFWETA